MNYQPKNWTALICATAIWFSFIASHWVQGAQLESAQQMPQIESNLQSISAFSDNSLDQTSLPVHTSVQSVFDWSPVATISVGVGALLLGYNLLTARKHGWAWFLLCTVGVVLGFIGKIGASMFCEISSDATGISDWDSDD